MQPDLRPFITARKRNKLSCHHYAYTVHTWHMMVANKLYFVKRASTESSWNIKPPSRTTIPNTHCSETDEEQPLYLETATQSIPVAAVKDRFLIVKWRTYHSSVILSTVTVTLYRPYSGFLPYRSSSVVVLSVGNERVLWKNGWICRGAVWGGRPGESEKLVFYGGLYPPNGHHLEKNATSLQRIDRFSRNLAQRFTSFPPPFANNV